MPATFPGYNGWDSLDGDYTLSDDRETLTLPASPTLPLRSGSIDTGGTLAQVQWDGTATGTVLGRTSAASLLGREDTTPLQPGSSEWSESFLASLGTKPSAQGWTAFGVTDSTPSGGLYTITAGYNRYVTTTLSASKLTVIRWSWRRNSGHVNRQSMYAITPMGTCLFYLNGSTYGADAGKVYDHYTSRYLPGVSMAEGTLWDFMVMIRSPTASASDITAAETVVWGRARGSYSETDLTGFTLLGQTTLNAGTGNSLYLGDTSGGTTNCSWGSCAIIDFPAACDQYGFEAVTDGDTSFARNQQHWQIKGGTLANGTLTGLDIMGNTSAPSDVAGLTVGAIGATGIGAVHTAVAGASAYYHEALDADNSDAVLEADYNYSPGCAFTVTAGNRKIRARAVTDDGVKSAVATTSSSTAVPTTSYTAPTIGAYPRWVDGELRFYKPTVGTASLSSYRILSASQPNGTYAVAVTLTWSSITWEATDGTGEYITSTTAGLTPGATTWYVDEIVDASNLSDRGDTAAYGGDEDSAECVVSFSDAGLASRTISVVLSHNVTVQGTAFPRSPYTVTLNDSGVGTLTLPRLDAATITDADTGTPFAVFQGASDTNWTLRRRIPNLPTATFSSLTSA